LGLCSVGERGDQGLGAHARPGGGHVHDHAGRHLRRDQRGRAGLRRARVPGKLLVLCVLTSTAASCQTTIMPTARAVLAMSAHGAIGKWFARMHPRFRTPTTATLVMGGISALFFVLLTAASKNVLADSAASVGLLIAFYYGLTGFACVWFFRRSLLGSVRDLVTRGILP